MRELTVATRTVHTEDNRPLTLEYLILVEDAPDGLEHYGIKITEGATGTSASASDLTMSARTIFSLVEPLASGAVTPTGLMDTLADLL